VIAERPFNGRAVMLRNPGGQLNDAADLFDKLGRREFVMTSRNANFDARGYVALAMKSTEGTVFASKVEALARWPLVHYACGRCGRVSEKVHPIVVTNPETLKFDCSIGAAEKCSVTPALMTAVHSSPNGAKETSELLTQLR
jgi:hypothetical protein